MVHADSGRLPLTVTDIYSYEQTTVRLLVPILHRLCSSLQDMVVAQMNGVIKLSTWGCLCGVHLHCYCLANNHYVQLSCCLYICQTSTLNAMDVI